MILITNSNDFEKIFLRNEYDSVILTTQFVIVSTRIKKKSNSNENIVVATRALFPVVDFYEYSDEHHQRDVYYNQLNSSKPFLAALVKGSIKKGYNIIFICSDNEWKTKYLKYIKDYIIEEFGYPVYNYKKYVEGCPLYKYDRDKTLKICNEVLNKAKKLSEQSMLKTSLGRKQILKGYKKKSKKILIKRVKNIGLYYEGMTRNEMVEIINAFL